MMTFTALVSIGFFFPLDFEQLADLAFERSVVTQHRSELDFFSRLACRRPIISHWETKKQKKTNRDTRTINSSISRIKLFNSSTFFSFFHIIVVAIALHLHSVVPLNMKQDHRMHFPFCRMLRLLRQPPAKWYNTQATRPHASDHRPFGQRNWCCVHCTCMLCIPKSTELPHPTAHPPSRRIRSN